MLITFEGIDGSGKTTQAKLLYEYLKNKSIDCCLSKEPYPFVNEIIQQFEIDKKTEFLLMMASRAIHQQSITNSLKTNKVVIIDRYIDSTYAYQNYGKHISEKKIKYLEKFLFGDKLIIPNLTILLDIDPIIAKERLKKSGKELTKTDKESLPFFKRVRMGYLELAKLYNRYKTINVENKSIEDIQKEIVNIVEKSL